MAFSREANLILTLKRKIQRDMILAKTNPDFKVLHPDEAKDAESGNYIKLKTRVTKKMQLHTKKAIDRRDRKKW